MQEIRVTDIEHFKIGQAEDRVSGTGCTVLLCPDGATAGLDVRGGGPASRESELLRPVAAAEKIHAVLLSGGSAFGLDAAGGVMRWLEERGVGFDTGVAKVPLVCASCLYDLTVGSCTTRPDAALGYAACEGAAAGNYQDGCFGAGTGASVGKYYGMEQAMKTGIGSYAVQLGELKVGAVVAVNALGDVFDWKDGRQVAGLLAADQSGFLRTEAEMYRHTQIVKNKFVGNTTIGAVLTNACFSKTEMNKIAAMAQNGLVRAIRPVNTTADGDSLYALSAGSLEADLDVVGTLAAQVVAEAILRAVSSATSSYGLIARRDLPWA